MDGSVVGGYATEVIACLIASGTQKYMNVREGVLAVVSVDYFVGLSV